MIDEAQFEPDFPVGERPFCPANWGRDVHNGPHSCIREDGHPEPEHRCPCGEDWHPGSTWSGPQPKGNKTCRVIGN